MNRRSFLLGLSSTLVAPTIVRAASLMPVRGIIMDAALSPMSIIMTPRMYKILTGNDPRYLLEQEQSSS